MSLTPEHVRDKRFTPVRLREGYDMGEVDQFLDEVESELERLNKENDDLRSKLAAAQKGGASASSTSSASDKSSAKSGSGTSSSVTASAGSGSGAAEEIKVTTVADASSAAARLLEIATRNADELVNDAKAEADKILGGAKASAERLASESKARADKMDADARGRAQALDTEIAAKRQEHLGQLEKDKSQLASEIENLRAFEREYRSRLKSYFNQQLAALDGAESEAEPSSGAPAPKRLKSILGDEDAKSASSSRSGS